VKESQNCFCFEELLVNVHGLFLSVFALHQIGFVRGNILNGPMQKKMTLPNQRRGHSLKCH